MGSAAIVFVTTNSFVRLKHLTLTPLVRLCSCRWKRRTHLLTGSFKHFWLEVAVDAGVYLNNRPFDLAAFLLLGSPI
jgi:hypothetical protein